MLCRFDPIAIENLHVVINPVSQLDRKPLRRIENYLYVMRTILVTRANPQCGLLLDCLGKFVSGSSHESWVEQIRAVLLKCGSQTLPGLEIISNCCFSSLLRQRPRTLQICWFHAHRGLSEVHRRGSHEDCATEQERP